jgi:uncharacterized protein
VSVAKALGAPTNGQPAAQQPAKPAAKAPVKK